jgi:type II secretory pathway pseudopilin PulG
MNLSGLSLRRSGRVRAPRHVDGFTVFQLVLATTALALAAHIAISEVGKYRARAQRDQFVADLREIQAAFKTYHAQKGTWPPATNPDIRTPLGMESALAATRWLAGPPFGGTYEWQLPPRPVAPTPAPITEDLADKPAMADKPAISVNATPPPTPIATANAGSIIYNPDGIIAITAFSPKEPLALTSKDLLYIDSKLDDGNLATGRFRTGFNGWPVYQIGPSP